MTREFCAWASDDLQLQQPLGTQLCRLRVLRVPGFQQGCIGLHGRWCLGVGRPLQADDIDIRRLADDQLPVVTAGVALHNPGDVLDHQGQAADPYALTARAATHQGKLAHRRGGRFSPASQVADRVADQRHQATGEVGQHQPPAAVAGFDDFAGVLIDDFQHAVAG